jgi:hypothetical protein
MAFCKIYSRSLYLQHFPLRCILMTTRLDTSSSSAFTKQPKGVERIPTKWSWSGDLFVNTGLDSAVQYGVVTFSEPTEAPQGELELRFTNFALNAGNSLRLDRFYGTHLLSLVRSACKPPTQLLKVSPKSESDQENFSKLVAFMARERLVG